MCELLNRIKNNVLEVEHLSLGCRYHKRKGERFGRGDILKWLKCPELFHAIYPKVLALMYDGQFAAEDLIIKCPGCDNRVTAALYAVPIKSIRKVLVNKFKKMLRPIRPMDILNYTVYFEIVAVEGNCPAAHKKGDRFEIHHEGVICHQALYSIFPAVLLSGDGSSCRCPSRPNRIVFKETFSCGR